MKGTYTAGSIPDPQDIVIDTATKITMYQLYIDLNAMDTGDILNVKVSSDTAGTERIFVDDTISIETITTPLATSFPFCVDVDDITKVTLEQTAGVEKSFPWSVVKVEQ